MEKVSRQAVISYLDNQNSDEYSNLIVGKGKGAFVVKLLERPLTVSERLAFSRFIERACTVTDGKFVPEIRDPVFKCAAVQMLTDLPTITRNSKDEGESENEYVDVDTMSRMFDIFITGIAAKDFADGVQKHKGFFDNLEELDDMMHLIDHCEYTECIKSLTSTMNEFIEVMSGELSETDMSQLVAVLSDSYGAMLAERAGVPQ